MVRSTTQAWSKRTWMLSGLLAVLSGSLILAAGCASGGSEAQLQSGSAKVYNYDEAAAADVGARFFYGPADDSGTSLWDESRMVWNTEGTNGVPIGIIGLETAGAPSFVLSGNANSNPKTSTITTSAEFYVVNNWDRPIYNLAAALPASDLVYALPSAGDIMAARLGGPGGQTMYQWLLNAPAGSGYFTDSATYFFGTGGTAGESAVQSAFNAAYNGTQKKPSGYMPPTGGEQNEFLLSLEVTPPEDESIPKGAKSDQTGSVTFVIQANVDYGVPQNQAATNEMVALAFSTYFGVKLDFQFPASAPLP